MINGGGEHPQATLQIFLTLPQIGLRITKKVQKWILEGAKLRILKHITVAIRVYTCTHSFLSGRQLLQQFVFVATLFDI